MGKLLTSGPLAYLQRLGYDLPLTAQSVIRECELWYRNAEVKKHKRETVNGQKYEMLHMGFGKRVCSDDASLCEVAEINAGGESEAQFDAVNRLLEENCFLTQFRRQLELCAALGTEACYVRQESADVFQNADGTQVLRGGRTRFNYVDGNGFFPLTVENDEVLEAAFVGETLRKGEQVTTLVICTRADTGRYQYQTVLFDKNGRVSSEETAELGEVKPFSVLRSADVNNIEGMNGYGLPKLKDAIPVLLALDMAFTALMGDIDDSEKITLINEALCKFDDKGDPIEPSQQITKRFVLLGDKLPETNTLVHEVVPQVRVEEFTAIIEFLLSMLSMQFGYGVKKYRFDHNQIVTATEYAGERQDQLQELNKQRDEAHKYIAQLIRAALWFLNTYGGEHWELDAEVLVEFDDSYIEDKNATAEMIRADVIDGIGGRKVAAQYLMLRYGITEQEALKWYEDGVNDTLGKLL